MHKKYNIAIIINKRNRVMTSAVLHIHDAWIILGCVIFVMLVAFGNTVCRVFIEMNRKYHIIAWDSNGIYALDDEEDDYE